MSDFIMVSVASREDQRRAMNELRYMRLPWTDRYLEVQYFLEEDLDYEERSNLRARDPDLGF